MPNTIKAGILLGLSFHAVHALLAYLGVCGTDYRNLFPLFIFGSQLFYMIPAIIIAALFRKVAVMQGILIVMGLTFLVSLAICGTMLVVATQPHH